MWTSASPACAPAKNCSRNCSTAASRRSPTGTPGLLMATPRTADPAIVGRAIDEIAAACRGGQVKLALTMLGRLVPEFAQARRGRYRTRLSAGRTQGTTPRCAFSTSGAAGPHRRRSAPAHRRRAGALPVHPRPGGRRAGAAAGAFCGAAHCVAVSSGTDALQIALMAEGVGPGDAVFLPAFTYTATAEVPLLLGATPVFVRRGPAARSRLTPASLADRIATVRARASLRPRALIGVDLFGQPADWPALRDLAARERTVHARRLRAEFRRQPARRNASAAPRTRPRSASSRRSRSAPMATAARC